MGLSRYASIMKFRHARYLQAQRLTTVTKRNPAARCRATRYKGVCARAVLGEYQTEPLRRGPYEKDRRPMFPQYGPEQTRSIRDLLHIIIQRYSLIYYTTFSVREDQNSKSSECSAREELKFRSILKHHRISCTIKSIQ